MKRLKLLFLMLPALVFGQENRVRDWQIYPGTAGSFLSTNPGGTESVWVTQAAARAAIFPSGSTNQTFRYDAGTGWMASSFLENTSTSIKINSPATATAPLEVAGTIVSGHVADASYGGEAWRIRYGTETSFGIGSLYSSGDGYFGYGVRPHPSLANTFVVGAAGLPYRTVARVGYAGFSFMHDQATGGSNFAIGTTLALQTNLFVSSSNGNIGIGANNTSPSSKLDVLGSIRFRDFSVANQLIRTDASGNLSQTLPAISTSGITTTLDFSSNLAKLKSTDEVREEVGASSHLYRKLTDGTMRRPQLVSNPSTIQSGSEWFDIAANAPTWAVGSTAADVRHAASVEGEFIGDAPTAHAASFTVGVTPKVLFRTVDANTGAITIKLDATMREGIPYTIACRRNTVNAITVDIPAGSQLDANGDTNFNDAPHTLPMHAVVTITRHSATNYTVK